MTREFSKRGFKKFSDDLEILAGIGADGVKDYAVLLQVNGFSYVVILNNDEKGRDVRQDLINSGIPHEKIVLLPRSANKNQQNFDVEDLFSIDVYAKAIHQKYSALIKIQEQDLIAKLKGGNEKVSNKAKAILRSVNADLDKVAVAYEILKVISNQQDLDSVTAKTLRFYSMKLQRQFACT